jgi:hypothetical protein
VTTKTLETKKVSDDFAATFAAFRDANDERLAEIEKNPRLIRYSTPRSSV